MKNKDLVSKENERKKKKEFVSMSAIIKKQMRFAEGKKPAIFFVTNEDKKKATAICEEVIDIIESSSDEILFKAFILQMLVESFEDTFDIDIKNGISISKTD